METFRCAPLIRFSFIVSTFFLLSYSFHCCRLLENRIKVQQLWWNWRALKSTPADESDRVNFGTRGETPSDKWQWLAERFEREPVISRCVEKENKNEMLSFHGDWYLYISLNCSLWVMHTFSHSHSLMLSLCLSFSCNRRLGCWFLQASAHFQFHGVAGRRHLHLNSSLISQNYSVQLLRRELLKFIINLAFGVRKL